MFFLWAGPPVIVPGSGSKHSLILIWPVPLKCYSNLMFLEVYCHMWCVQNGPDFAVLVSEMLNKYLLCTYTVYDPHYVEKVWVFVHWDAQTGSVKMECLFYVKLNNISLWASLLPVPLSVLCSFPFPNKAVSPRCINAHQRPQSSCFATG